MYFSLEIEVFCFLDYKSCSLIWNIYKLLQLGNPEAFL